MVEVNPMNKAGTNPLIDHSKNEGFGPTISDNHAQKRQVGTRGLISDNRANNEQKQDLIDQSATQNPQNRVTDNENIINNNGSDDNIHNQNSSDVIETGVHFEPKLDPKTPQTAAGQTIF